MTTSIQCSFYPLRGFYLRVFFLLTTVSNTYTPVLVGATIGLGLAAVGFFTLPWYHDFLVWTYASPWTWIIGISGGAALAIATDD